MAVAWTLVFHKHCLFDLLFTDDQAHVTEYWHPMWCSCFDTVMALFGPKVFTDNQAPVSECKHP